MIKKISTRGKYYASHYENVITRVPISKSNLDYGMVVSIEYRASYRIGKKVSLYVIIQPRFNDIVHVIDLDYVKPTEFLKFINLCIGKSTRLLNLGNFQVYTFPFTQKDQALYNALRPLVSEQAYRKLKPNKIRDLKIVQMSNLQDMYKDPNETGEEKKGKKDKLKKNAKDTPKPKKPEGDTNEVDSTALLDEINRQMLTTLKDLF